jgi:alpha-1,6-mannosyltransferase
VRARGGGRRLGSRWSPARAAPATTRAGASFLPSTARRRAGRAGYREVVVAASLAVSLAAAAVFALSAAGGSIFLVPSGHEEFPGWLEGPLSGLGVDLSKWVEIGLVAAMGLGWAVVLASRVSLPRATIGTIAGLHLVMILAPPLLSTDVFGYIAFGRLDVVHGFSAYADSVDAIPADPVNPFLSPVWPTELSSPYGPLFLVPTYVLAPFGVPASLWGLKVFTGLAALACVALVAACARRLELDPLRSAAFVGLNPLWFAWTVGGAHNDLPMVLLALAGVLVLLAGHERLSGGLLAGAIAVKATAGLLALFMLAGVRGRGRVLAGGLIGGALLIGAFLAIFGTDLFLYVPALLEQGGHVSRHNVPRELVELLGYPEVTDGVKVAANVLFLGTVVALLLAVRRGADWVTAAGWATIAFLLTTTSLHTWYVAALLPLAAISRSRALRAATVAVTLLLAVIQLTPAA